MKNNHLQFNLQKKHFEKFVDLLGNFLTTYDIKPTEIKKFKKKYKKFKTL